MSWRWRRWMYGNGLRSADHLSLPDFLGIGAQKSGTSWLHENLRHHPDAFLPRVKEVHYFDSRFDEQPIEEYAAMFRQGAGRIKGEITPAYSILEIERIRFIRAVMPCVRLVLLVRNPIDRAWSHALMTLMTHAGRRFEDISSREFFEQFSSSASRSRGDYETILNNWLGVFPTEQLYVGFFEDVAREPVALLREVCRHIGLTMDVDWEKFPYRQTVYAGPQIPLPRQYLSFLRDLYGPRIVRLRRYLGARVECWLD